MSEIICGLLTNPGIKCFSFPQFNSPFDHTKYTSNMAARFYGEKRTLDLFSDVIAPLVYRRPHFSVLLGKKHWNINNSIIIENRTIRHKTNEKHKKNYTKNNITTILWDT